MFLPSIIEGRKASHSEGHAAADYLDAADQFVIPEAVLGAAYRHIVRDLPDPIWGEEYRNQNIGLRPVALFAADLAYDRRDLEASALFVVEDSCEDARGIEVGAT